MIEQEKGQMSMFDQDTWFGKTYPEHCPQTKERTSAASSKKRQGSPKKIPLFLDLRRGGGVTQEASWETGGVLHGEYMMHSIGAYLNEENEYVLLPTSMDTQQQKYCLTLNISEKPRTPMPSSLSEILEESADEKYNLSARACNGILSRANRRGKQLPEILQKALEAQAVES